MAEGWINYNLSYFILVLPVVIISMICSARVKSAYQKYSRFNNARGLTGAQAAALVLQSYGINNVQIQRIDGELTDNYNPKTNIISLSSGVYGSCSIAAVGIACHEAGHAAQHAEGYGPIKVRNVFVKPAQIGSTLAIPLAILGYILGFLGLVKFGIFLYAFIMLFQLVTLPVEFNASSRALKVIEQQNMLQGEEYDGAKKVLKAAAMTYVAAFAVSAANLLRLLTLLSGGKRRR
jgi:Zn-dependent membrane protease YugP